MISKDKNKLDISTWSDFDDDALSSAARRYTSLRRRLWRCLFGIYVFGMIALAPLIVAELMQIKTGVVEQLNPVVYKLIAVLLFLWIFIFGVVSFICWVVMIFTTFLLNRFRCPRCAKRFVGTFWITWPGKTCRHCGLYLG